MNYKKIAQNHSFTKMPMNILDIYNSCDIWKYHSSDMEIHSHTIGLIGVTELGTITFHFAPNRRRFYWSISRWKWLRRKIFFGESLRSRLSLLLPSFIIFQPLINIVSPF